MLFREMSIEDKYRSDKYPDLGTDFVSKMLEGAVIYKRAVGFFSSSALVKLSHGISYLVSKPNCHIYFVVSPVLYKEDIEAIRNGYKKRSQVVEEALLREFKDTSDEFECERLNFLSHLVAENILDIKVADKLSSSGDEDLGMFHEKIGLFVDENGDKVAFSGSLNESDNAFSRNFESIQVFKSWEEPKRVIGIEDDFDRLWNNETGSLQVYDFPDAVKERLFQYHKPTYHRDIDEYEKRQKAELAIKKALPSYNFPYPLYGYQKKAINKWANQNFQGIFDMGTGTGKTLTAYTAAVKLLERLKYRLAVIVVCPYTHLVEQWVADAHYFNINFIVGYSSYKYSNYLSQLSEAVQDYNDNIRSYFFFITTNASYQTQKVQKVLSELKGNVLFIGDEVHNFGAEKLRVALNTNYRFRIGLSATVDRHRDEEGTAAIYKYFGEPVIHYGLKEAIASGVLTRYFYKTIPVYLTEDEREKYLEYTDAIRKNSYKDNDGNVALTKQGEFYAIKRARIIATASGKVSALREALENYKKDYNILVYCGTGKSDGNDEDETRQIDQVCKMMGLDLGMRIARYTSKETIEERRIISDRYKSGNDLQALVAIKCLDEGVNIPSIKTAFILASSTNPREYIQRRGRVLRKFPGKDYSYIYDFVTLPVSLDKVSDFDPSYISGFKALVRNEVDRIKEFASLAENQSESDMFINKIIETFELDKYDIPDEFEKIDWSLDDYD